MATDRVTSTPVHASTLRMLQPFKRGGMTWDGGLTDFIEEHPPKAFEREIVRRTEAGPGIPWRRAMEQRERRRLPVPIGEMTDEARRQYLGLPEEMAVRFDDLMALLKSGGFPGLSKPFGFPAGNGRRDRERRRPGDRLWERLLLLSSRSIGHLR